MTDLTLGSTYRKGFIDTSSEIIPKALSFKSFPSEEHVFDEHDKNIPFHLVISGLESGHITELDKLVVSLVAVFGSAACTSKTISEMLTLMGIDVNKNILESSLKRLHRYHLINFSRFSFPNGKQSNTRIITLMSYGSKLARNFGVVHRFNPISIITAEPYSIKSRAETAQLICNWLKNLPVDSFAVRPVKIVNADAGAIIRPAASIDLCGETIYFEVPRTHDGWLSDLIAKFNRYKLVFGENDLPTIVVNGEDAGMNLEIFKELKDKDFKAEVLFTDDLSMFGRSFKSCLYTFDDSDSIIRYTFKDTESEVS